MLWLTVKPRRATQPTDHVNPQLNLVTVQEAHTQCAITNTWYIPTNVSIILKKFRLPFAAFRWGHHYHHICRIFLEVSKQPFPTSCFDFIALLELLLALPQVIADILSSPSQLLSLLFFFVLLDPQSVLSPRHTGLHMEKLESKVHWFLALQTISYWLYRLFTSALSPFFVAALHAAPSHRVTLMHYHRVWRLFTPQR